MTGFFYNGPTPHRYHGILMPCCMYHMRKFHGYHFTTIVMQLMGIILFVIGTRVPSFNYMVGQMSVTIK